MRDACVMRVASRRSVGDGATAIRLSLSALPAQVIEGDVNEALRLMNMSKISLEDEDVQEQVQQDPVREAFAKACLLLVYSPCASR